MRKAHLKIIANVCLLIFMGGLIIYLLRHSFHHILKQIIKTNPLVLGIIVLFGLCYLWLEGRNISLMCRSFQKKFTTRDGFFAACYSAFYRVVSLGSGTMIAEVLFYRQKKIATTKAAGITMIHMIFYKLSVLLFGLISFLVNWPIFQHTSWYQLLFSIAALVLTAAIILFLLFLSLNVHFHSWLIKKSHQLVKKKKWRDKLDNFHNQIISLRLTVQTILQNKTLLYQLCFLNILKLIVWYSIPFLVLSESHQLSYYTVFSYLALVVAFSGVIPTPAGLGSFEFIYLWLFKPLVGTVDAVSSMLLYRFVTYFLPFFIGMIYAAVRKQRQIDEEIQELKQVE